MPYITVPQTPRRHQITFEDIISGEVSLDDIYGSGSKTGTTTWFVDRVNDRFRNQVNVRGLISELETYNIRFRDLHEADRNSLYRTFHVPKKTRGFRRIDAPNDELKEALRQLKSIFEDKMRVLYHTSAYAYVKNRCTVDSIKRHQMNQSRWFLKTDFSDFFGSTTQEFLMDMLSKIWPISEIMSVPEGKDALTKAVSLCFLNGGLPQGTPISPLLTNVMMIPIDHAIANGLVGRHFVYTRYADDILISHRFDFDHNEVIKEITEILNRFSAPFEIKKAKTRYGSSSGQNWNLGVMLNKDNKITIGRKKKEQFRHTYHNYLMDRKNGIKWDVHDLQVFYGQIAYYKMVEPDYMKGVLEFIGRKYEMNLLRCLREDLR